MEIIFIFYVMAQAGLVLLYQLRVEFPVMIPRYFDTYFPHAAFQRLTHITVTAVIGLFVPVIIFAVARFRLKLTL